MSADMVALRRKDGTAEFECMQCGSHVISFAFQGREPLCEFCTVLGEHSIAIQARINRSRDQKEVVDARIRGHDGVVAP
jgi:hypothetical protein